MRAGRGRAVQKAPPTASAVQTGGNSASACVQYALRGHDDGSSRQGLCSVCKNCVRALSKPYEPVGSDNQRGTAVF